MGPPRPRRSSRLRSPTPSPPWRARRSSGARTACSSATTRPTSRATTTSTSSRPRSPRRASTSGGEYTLLAPANSAFDKHNNEVGTPITADVLKYHVIEGKKTMDALNTDQKTLNGGTLTAYRKFRKNWLDGAIIGLKSEGPSKSSNWPSDVECDNGIIQAIDTVLVPGAYV